VHANPAAIELLSMDPTRARGHHMFAAIPSEDTCSALELVLRGGEGRTTPVEREIELPQPSGVTLRVQVRVVPLRKQGAVDDAPEGALAVVHDVTEQRIAERARVDFFTNASHELKTPVTAIQGIVETLLDDQNMPGDVRDRFLRKATRQAARLGTLVTDLIGLARIESSPGTIHREQVGLAALIADCIAQCTPAAEAAELDIVFLVAGGEEVCILADEESLRQAITNLVVNAISHGASGGEVRITLLDAGVLSSDPRSGRIEIVVADDGPGIDPEHQPRIFERFYRVDAARSRERGGTGLGLSIVKHVALAHGGDVAVTSEPGAGATFTFALPRHSE